MSCSRHCAESPKVIGVSQVAEVVYYGIDVKRFSPSDERQDFREQLGLSRNAPVVLFVGRMVTEMGLETLLNAAPRILQSQPNARFVIAGQVGDLYGQALKAREAYPEAIHVLVNVGNDDLPLLYATATLVVVPSSNERACLGLAAIEAMASGIPVVVTHSGGGPEVVVDGETGLLVPPNDSAALAKAVLTLLSDPGRCSVMGKHGRERAVRIFDKDITNGTMVRTLEEVAGR